jgi:uncharacterized phage protein gp47/JayE
MTAPQITTDGILIQTFAQIFDELADDYRTIYGNDINVDQEAPDGQRIGIEARERLDMQSLALQIYNSFDPDLAVGISLNRILKLSGLFLRPSTRSQVDVEIDAAFPLTLSSSYTVKDELNQNWITTDEKSLIAGVNVVTLFAEDVGQIEADPDTVTEPVTIVLGVNSVTNPAAADPGQDEETEPEARIRRNASLENPATSNRGSMFARLGNIANVTDLAVYENKNAVDTPSGIPGHGIWVVIEGGTIEDIAEIMAKNKHDGTAMRGAITEIYEETLTRPDGSTFTIQHAMQFDRPTDVPLTVVVDAAKKNPSDVINVSLIQEAIAARCHQCIFDSRSDCSKTIQDQ